MRSGRRRSALGLVQQRRMVVGDAIMSKHWKDEREIVAIDEVGVLLRIPSFRNGRPNGCVYKSMPTLPHDTAKVTAASWSTEYRVRQLEARVAELESQLARLIGETIDGQ